MPEKIEITLQVTPEVQARNYTRDSFLNVLPR